MKYILVLFAVFLLLAYSDARPKGRKQNKGALNAEFCEAQLSKWMSVDAKRHVSTPLGAVAKCFKDHGYALCSGVTPDGVDIDEMCKAEMEAFLGALPRGRQQREVAHHERERRRTSTTGTTGTTTTTTSITGCPDDFNLREAVTAIIRDVIAAIQNASCSDDDIFCIILAVLDGIEEVGEEIDCLFAIGARLSGLF